MSSPLATTRPGLSCAFLQIRLVAGNTHEDICRSTPMAVQGSAGSPLPMFFSRDLPSLGLYSRLTDKVVELDKVNERVSWTRWGLLISCGTCAMHFHHVYTHPCSHLGRASRKRSCPAAVGRLVDPTGLTST